jgi:hypothetical protein
MSTSNTKKNKLFLEEEILNYKQAQAANQIASTLNFESNIITENKIIPEDEENTVVRF